MSNSEKWINSGFSFYYAVSCLLGAIFGVISLLRWLYKVMIGEAPYSSGILALIIVLTVVLGFIGIVLLKISKEEFDK